MARLRRQKFAEDDKDDVSLYDIEFGNGSLGIQFETDFYGNHATVKQVIEGGVASKVVKFDGDKSISIIQEGHIVVAVNGQDVSNEPFQKIIEIIKKAKSPRIIRFLDPKVLPLVHLNQNATEQLLNRDNYGFAKEDNYILQYRKHIRMKKAQQNTYATEKEWVDFIQEHGGMAALDIEYNSTNSKEKLKAQLEPLIVRGIPTAFRAPIWAMLTNVAAYKANFLPTYYHDIISGELRSSTLDDIEKDVGRTYPEHAYFQDAKGKQELTNVLVAYSVHNTSIGYCQSMNFLVGILLLFLTEEESFWLLCVLMEKYLPTENYSRSMLGSQVDQVVFKKVVELQMPRLSRVFDDAGIEIELITLQWFLCVYVCTLPLDTALRVWDYMFLHGEEVLFSVAIGIFRSAEEKLMEAANSHSQLFMVVRELGLDLHDADTFMEDLAAFHQQKDFSIQSNSRHEVKANPIDIFLQKFNDFSSKLLRKDSFATQDDNKNHVKKFSYELIQKWRSEIRPGIEAREMASLKERNRNND